MSSQSGPESAAPLPASASTSGARKKFATPPVKIACLACRASRTRCDGGHPCASCQAKARDCIYKPSKRGGARVRRKPRLDHDGPPPQEIPSEPAEVYQAPIPVQNYIDPGAGLRQLADWYQDSDYIFDSLFVNSMPEYMDGDSSMGTMESQPDLPQQPVPMVRIYKDDAAILEAYYIFIHPYFPILPPPSGIPLDNFVPRLQNQQPSELDGSGDFEPTSPIALAISAVLALIPCANDVNHAAHESLLFRRGYAQLMAQSALETVEAESEIPESYTVPHAVLSSENKVGSEDYIDRPPFHPGMPRELESIVALDILSVYEYAQRGNLKKMQSRAGQALVNAMALALHETTEDDAFSEARRRVWWMTYAAVCQASIVSNVQPTFTAFSPSFTARFPTIQADPEAYAVYIKAQQAILTATQFVIDMNKTMQTKGDMSRIYQRMLELEATLEPLLSQAEAWDLRSPTTLTVDPCEEVVGRSLRCMARIKLNSSRIKVHRYCAFFDIPVFTARHCDLKTKSSLADELSQELRQWPSCSCSVFTSSPGAAGDSSASSTSGASGPKSHQSSSSPASDGGGGGGGSGVSSTPSSCTMTPFTAFPFSSHASAKICLRCALNIAADFDRLPYPNPSAMAASSFGTAANAAGFGSLGPSAAAAAASAAPGGGSSRGTAPNFAWYLSPTSSIVAPRTMPSFACCAMQSAYALLMVHQKTRALNTYPYGGGSPDKSNAGGAAAGNQQPPGLVGSLVSRLKQGLVSILTTLENYAVASEALGGMRDQIRSATLGAQL